MATDDDPGGLPLKDQIDRLVRDRSRDEREYIRYWKQIRQWAYNKTNDSAKKKRLKEQLLRERGTRCEDCGRESVGPELHMHRLDPSLADDRTSNFGYVEHNVALLCVVCHRKREGLDVEVGE